MAPVPVSSRIYTRNTAPRLPSARDTAPWYLLELLLKKRLNGRNSQPNSASITRVSRSLGASWGLSSMAASAGDRVSELIVEITVEMAMVTANCR